MVWSTLFSCRFKNSRSVSLSRGLTLIEVLLATFIIGVVVVGLFGLFVLSMRSAQEGERRVVAIALANERMEMIRNLPYVDVGTSGGIPQGEILQDETVTRNGVEYQVKTDIRYVDDIYDGSSEGSTSEEEQIIICHIPPGHADKQTTIQVGASSLDAHLAHGDYTGPCGAGGGDGTNQGDEYNADYKLARVEVDWSGQYHVKPVLLITHIVPRGIEGGELGGTLDLHVAAADGLGIIDATVEIINEEVDPNIHVVTQTNEEGRVVMPGFPEMADSYQIKINKEGYSSEQTYDLLSDFIPDADHSHLSMIVREVTSKLFFIDEVANLSVNMVDEDGAVAQNVSYIFKGEKTIGNDVLADGSTEPRYKVYEEGNMGVTGAVVFEDLEWDTYSLLMPSESEYLIKESWPFQPIQLDPGAEVDMRITLVPYSDFSVQVTVTNLTGEAVDNATVRLERNGALEEKGTGVPGQVIFTELLETGDYNLEVEAGGYNLYAQVVEVTGNEVVKVELENEI
jgi:type II secretory pathway pseudopilin PulG